MGNNFVGQPLPTTPQGALRGLEPPNLREASPKGAQCEPCNDITSPTNKNSEE